jgi:hypothetical protein
LTREERKTYVVRNSIDEKERNLVVRRSRVFRQSG